MTTSISCEAFEKKNRKLKKERSGQKNHKWKNGQSELVSDHKKLRKEEKHFIKKITKPYVL